MGLRVKPMMDVVRGPALVERISREGGYRKSSVIREGQILLPSQIPASFRVGEAARVEVATVDLAEQIGVEFKRIPGGIFIYQGERANISTYDLAETPFTIGQMRALLKSEKGAAARETFTKDNWGIDAIINKSKAKIAADVPADQRDNCPLIYVNKIEAEAIVRLLDAELQTDAQFERAAAGTTGLKRPWGNDLDPEKAVYDDKGLMPVKSKPAGKSPEGIYDLIGLVWERTKESSILRGGSWGSNSPGCLQSGYRGVNFGPEDRGSDLGFRPARTIKS